MPAPSVNSKMASQQPNRRESKPTETMGFRQPCPACAGDSREAYHPFEGLKDAPRIACRAARYLSKLWDFTAVCELRHNFREAYVQRGAVEETYRTLYFV
jgi:hypothetical protein